MPRGNPSPKLAITVDPEIHENILAAAADRNERRAWAEHKSAAEQQAASRGAAEAVAL
jgi:hypothetical protein